MTTSVTRLELTPDSIKRQLPLENYFQQCGSVSNNKGRWRCLFPERHANGDAHPSVTIRDQRATCHSRQCFAGADVFDLIGLKEGLTEFLEQKQRALELAGLAGNGSGDSAVHIESAYDYRDETGELLYQVVRYKPKDFRQRRPNGNGGWSWNLKDTRLVLYRLPETLKADSVLIVEGEKDVDTAYSLGLPDGWGATCNPMGAGKWRERYSESLTGRRVVILPDSDEPGQKHGGKIASALKGKTREIFKLTLPDGVKDLSEWASGGKSSADLSALLQTATPYQEDGSRVDALLFTPLRDLLNEPEEATDWLVENRLPAGGLSLLCGKPKAGKTTLVRNLALSISRGTTWLGFPTVQGKVFYLALEEKRSEVRKHFAAMGAGPSDEVHVFCAPSPNDGLAQLRKAAERDKPVLVIVDPLLKMVRVKDANDYAAVTVALEPLLTLARETGAHVMAVHHMGKGDRDGGDAILGSTAIFAAVDTALLLKRTDKYRTLSTIQRYGDDLEEITLNLIPDTRTVMAGVPRHQADEEAMGKLLLEFLNTQSDPVEEPTIHEAVEGRKGIKVKALRGLVESGQVTRSGEGKRGNPYRYRISSFLVPTIYREPENQKSENGATPLHDCTNSGSEDLGMFATSSGCREQENGVIDLAD